MAQRTKYLASRELGVDVVENADERSARGIIDAARGRRGEAEKNRSLCCRFCRASLGQRGKVKNSQQSGGRMVEEAVLSTMGDVGGMVADGQDGGGLEGWTTFQRSYKGRTRRGTYVRTFGPSSQFLHNTEGARSIVRGSTVCGGCGAASSMLGRS